MSKFEKLLERIRNNPKTVSFEELDRILIRYGFTCRQPRGGSSHYVYTLGDYPSITVPYKRPFVKQIYVKKVIEILEQIEEDFIDEEDV
jgi:hypothetical protein